MKRLIIGLAAGLCAAAFASAAFASNCSGYSYTLQNGQTADANQVMANFNSILNCANSNLAHKGANSDITSLTGLSTPLAIAYGGTGNTTGAGQAVADQTLMGNISGGSAPPIALTVSQVQTLLLAPTVWEWNVFSGGVQGNAWEIGRYNPSSAVTIVSGVSNASVAATASTTFTLKNNGASIGTVVFGAGSATGTVTITSGAVIAGHLLQIDGPATADATLADINVTLSGTRP